MLLTLVFLAKVRWLAFVVLLCLAVTGQLSWLVYLIGYVIGGRIAHLVGDDYDSMDGQLVCRVLQLMNLIDSTLPQVGREVVGAGQFLA